MSDILIALRSEVIVRAGNRCESCPMVHCSSFVGLFFGPKDRFCGAGGEAPGIR